MFLKIYLICFWQLEVQYFHDHATLTTAVALKQSPVIDVSATVGTPTIALGAEAGYDTSSGGFTKYTAGISVTRPDSSASVILLVSFTHKICVPNYLVISIILKANKLILNMYFPISGDKGDSIKASYLHHLDLLKKSAAVAEITRKFSTNENIFTVGGSFAVDPLTQVKARLNNHGKLGALLQHEIIPKSVFTVSGEIDTKALDKKPRFGLAIALKPWGFYSFLRKVIGVPNFVQFFWWPLKGGKIISSTDEHF